MAPQPANPSASVTAGYESRTIASAESMASQLALDNLLRRELKVGDPRDARQVAEALFSRYKDDPRAQAITQEARGLPFLATAATPPAPAMPAATATNTELQQAISDVERDLEELTTNSLLKSNAPELKGWEQAIRTAIAEGTTAARFGLDPRQRDKTFGIRRLLGDYARLARFVGAMTPPVTMSYRKLAQSLDEVAAVLLVMLGEALANVGFSSGQYLLQVPFSELQVRRDAVICALRNLAGSVQEAYIHGSNEFTRGLNAYRELYNYLESSGQGDLRSLLVEVELASIMDALIQRAGQGTPEGLRALGATARLDLERFQRLVIVGQYAVRSPAPPLTAFLESLDLFADAFVSAGGRRLLVIARPPILFYGLYMLRGGVGGNPVPQAQQAEQSLVPKFTGDRLLLRTIECRGWLAAQIDNFARLSFDGLFAVLVVLDKMLYDLDRVIDLYAVGTSDSGDAECRASAYAFVIEAIATHILELMAFFVGTASIRNQYQQWEELVRDLTDIVHSLKHPIAEAKTKPQRRRAMEVIFQELYIQKTGQGQWEDMVRTIAPECLLTSLFHKENVFNSLRDIIENAEGKVKTLLASNAYQDVADEVKQPTEDIEPPQHRDASFEDLAKAVHNGVVHVKKT